MQHPQAGLVHSLGPVGDDPTAFRGRQEQRLHAKFGTQANALFRKNGVQQRRAWVQTLVTVSLPIVFCLLLFLLQKLLNNALDTVDNRCGCFCSLCYKDIDGVLQPRNSSSPDNPCQTWDDCVTYDTNRCGFQYSSSSQAAFCAIDTPSVWPALMQSPVLNLTGAQPLVNGSSATAPPTVLSVPAMYTGADQTVAQQLMAALFINPNITSAGVAAAAASFQQSNISAGSINAAAFSQLGLVLGTPQDSDKFYSMFVEPAFVDGEFYNATLFSIVKDAGSATSQASATLLRSFASLLAGNASVDGADTTALLPTTYTLQPELLWQPSSDDINDQTFCAYQQARCDGTPALQTWDWQDTSAGKLAVRLGYNASERGNDGPPTILRVNQGLNRASNAFLQWALGGDSRYQAWLLGLQDMPKSASRLDFDFSSLLGPLFFCWLLQMLLPVMVYTLVYEKERRLRTMMKMHGLGDAAYWGIQYGWFFLVNFVFTWILIIFGSIIRLNFFTKTDYSFQFVFYLLWINCLIAFSFLLSTLFRSSKTAVTVGYLYVFGTGLVAFLLIQQFVAQQYWWVIFLELVPGWALYRGLYEISQYAFRAAQQGTKGITWARLGDANNGLPAVMVIMAVEWLVFMAAAWYLEQVLDTGVGVPRHPLFFLGGNKKRGGKHRQRAARGCWPWRRGGADSSEEAVTIAVEAEDVRAERLRVEEMPQGGEANAAAIVIRDLRKTFPPVGGGREKQAVRGLSLAIERGECFGLLGPNGAGKSTTINILTGFLEPTEGTAIVEGHDIRRDMPTIYSMMGVCPQDNLLWERLTAREHLMFFGRMKNLKGQALKEAVEAALQSVNLWHGGVGDKQVRTYSGGMKRRLSVAISFIGDPLVVYLDEPSTGLDPASRQNLWAMVKAAKQQRGIILTTHSMEEATALCDRLGIFVDGALVCVGNPKELTSRYGGYYVFTITTPVEQEGAAEQLVRRLSPGARLTYSLGGTRKYELPVGEVTLPGVFDAVGAAKQSGLTVLDWGVANATLEEVFIQLAKEMGLEAGSRTSSRRQIRARAGDAAAAAAAAGVVAPLPAVQAPLVYSGIIFDMDGTLTVSNIDYVTMRQKTGIPVGDLFTVMESWDDGDRIKRSMDTILELEAQACASLQPMPGLLGLLSFLRGSGVRVGLVTRNTTESLNSLFAVIGEEWRDAFDILLTRDNTPYVKPDKRSLLHFAEAWGMRPWELLMVGDSTEDIETANAAGTASCLIAGGGNETSAAAAAASPPRGAVPTFTVDSLSDLQRRLAACDTSLGWGAYGSATLSLPSSDSDDGAAAGGSMGSADSMGSGAGLAGAPPEGLDFLDALFALGAVQAASCSFPRIDGSRFGTPPDAHPGDRVLHLACGNGALTKLLFSSGLQVIGVDEEVAEATRRGLLAVALSPLVLGAGSLQPELAAMGGLFDAAVLYVPSSAAAAADGSGSSSGGGGGLADSLWRAGSLAELRRVLKPGGRLCVQAPLADEAAARGGLEAAGWALTAWETTECGAVRLVAALPSS